MAELGKALTGQFSFRGTQAQIFEKGATLRQNGSAATIHFNFPFIGRPHIAAGAAGAINVLPDGAITFRATSWDIEKLRPIVTALCVSRIALLKTGTAGEPVKLRFDYVGFSGLTGHRISCHGEPASSVLHDVAVRGAKGWTVVAPHAVYYRDDWSQCGVAHLTDTHLARRIDGFHDALMAAGRAEAAAQMYNWNDRFRGFIRYANYLHGAGLLDVVLVTGDFTDYIFEQYDDRNGGGNAAFARDVLLGRSSSSTFGEVEELLVPIFIIGGNHDYRKNPYPLFFELNIPGNNHNIENHSGYNLDQDSACAILPKRKLKAKTAATFVEVDQENRPFKTYLVDRLSYVIELGRHRIVMIDSEWDVGIVDELGEAIWREFGLGSEDQATFVGGSPNSEGVSDRELDLLKHTLNTAALDGVFVVGIHAPLLNPVKTQLPFYLRETQRKAHGTFVENLLRHYTGGGRGVHPSWYSPSGEEPSYVKRGDNSHLLDYAVSRGRANEALRACAGVGVARAADVVLQGHVHRHSEFRIGKVGDDLAYYMDFYTSNPKQYYSSSFWESPISARVAYVHVEEDAPASGRPFKVSYEAARDYAVKVPPYRDPLDRATDKAGWWNKHRPLLLQTGAMGPRDTPDVAFNGFRLLSIKNNHIDTIRFVSIDELNRRGYVWPWEEVLQRPARPAYRHRQRTFDGGGKKGRGKPFGFIAPMNGSHVIVYRTEDNDILEAWRQDTIGFGVISGNAPKLAGDCNPSVCIDLNRKNQTVLYRAGDGSVHGLYYDQGAVGHDRLSQSAGAPVAASDPVGTHYPPSDLYHVFYRKADGRIHELWWKGPDPVSHGDLTGNHPRAKGRLSAIVQDDGLNVVFYRGTDDHIHILYWTTGSVSHEVPSQAAGAAHAAGDPSGVYLASGKNTHIYYRSRDNHIIELHASGGSPVTARNLTALAGAPLADGDPFAYYVQKSKKHHVVYRAIGGKVIGLWWGNRDKPPVWVDLSKEAIAPQAASDINAFHVGARNYAIYRDEGGYIHEIGWADSYPGSGILIEDEKEVGGWT